MKALILAAGFGKRLRELTQEIPKPLVSISEIPLIFFTLYNLKQAGINEIIINLHYKGEKIKQLLKNGHKYDLDISYSEEPEILGTGGAIKKVEPFFKGENNLLVLNSDIVSNICLTDMIQFHQKHRAIATLGVKENFKKDFFYNPETLELCSIIKETINTSYGVFTGIQVLDNEIFKYTECKFSSSIDTYVRYIREKKNVLVYPFKNYFWYDLGIFEENPNYIEELSKNYKDHLSKVKQTFFL